MHEHEIASPLRDGDGAIGIGAHHRRRVLRCRESDVGAAAITLGICLPVEPCRAATSKGVAALWLGPDEWLILGEHEAAATNPPKEMSGSLIDVSHRQVAIVVEGEGAEEILSSGCPIDLAVAAFPVGACTRTLFHKAEIVLWRPDTYRFHLEVWRSFARYVQDLLIEAERER